MRITGLATGLDMDEIIKNSMKPYRIKIQQQQQNKEVVEIKQKLYRDIISDASKFYDKYFDLTKSDSLLNSNSYKSVLFSSSSSSVSVTGNSDAKAETYKVTGTTSKPATHTIEGNPDTVVINGKEFSLTEKDNTEKAKNLNDELKKAGINVTATASDFTSGNIVLESKDVGKNASFTVGGTAIEKTFSSTVGKDATKTIVELSKDDILSGTIKIGDKDIVFEDWESTDDKVKKINEVLKDSGISAVKSGDGIKLTSTKTGSDSDFDVTKQDGTKIGTKTLGEDATKSQVKLSMNDIENKKIKINGKIVDLTGVNMNSDDLTKALEGTGVKAEVNGTEITLTSESTGSNSKFDVVVKDTLGSSTSGENAKAAEYTIQDEDIVGNEITINGKTINLSEADTIEKKVDQLNKELSSSNMVAKVDGDKIILTSKVAGADGKISINGTIKDTGTDATNSTVTGLKAEKMIINGKEVDLTGVTTTNELEEKLKDTGVIGSVESDGSITLTSIATGSNSSIDVNPISNGVVNEGKDGTITIVDSKENEIEKTLDSSNSVTVDGVTLKFNGPIDGETITISGKNEITEVKDKLVKFINDYNTLIEKLNTLTSTKHDRSYVPLTDEQKKEMSETEIKLWNERVENGQLYRDSDLTRITSSLKSTMRTFMEGTGLNLEAIGISPVQDYSGTKNGTFTINEEKLTKALEENMDDVMNLFIGNSEDTSQKGIMLQLKDTLYSEFKSSSSVLSKKVGMEGTSTFSNNELTKSISKYEQKIKDMEKDFSRREQALYSKYATLETMMNKLNAQQSNLLSQLGMS